MTRTSLGGLDTDGTQAHHIAASHLEPYGSKRDRAPGGFGHLRILGTWEAVFYDEYGLRQAAARVASDSIRSRE